MHAASCQLHAGAIREQQLTSKVAATPVPSSPRVAAPEALAATSAPAALTPHWGYAEVLAPSALLEGIFVEKVFEDTEQLLDTLQRVRPLLSGEIPSAKRVRLVVRSPLSLVRSFVARSFSASHAFR